jgi:alpha-beta hydrolase superfamily lysophospholipase
MALAPHVHLPTLLLHGGLDRTASPRGAQRLARALGSTDVELKVFPKSGHVLPLDLDGAAVSAAVVEFFQRAEV